MKPQPCLPGILSPVMHPVPKPDDPPLRFDGATYQPAVDDVRLTGQLKRVYDLMADGHWRSLAEIAHLTGDPAASVSAQLRHLRKKRFGAYDVQRRPCGDRAFGLYVYRVFGARNLP